MVTGREAPIEVVRRALEADLARLVVIEAEAGQRFHSVGMPLVARHAPDSAGLQTALCMQRLWVAQVGPRVVGYVAATGLDGLAHVAQVSVEQASAGRGIGRRLMEVVEASGRDSGCPATTLTTFHDVPWNAPYYRRLGYRVMTGDEVGPDLAATMASEKAVPGLLPAQRCAMIKLNVF